MPLCSVAEKRPSALEETTDRNVAVASDRLTRAAKYRLRQDAIVVLETRLAVALATAVHEPAATRRGADFAGRRRVPGDPTPLVTECPSLGALQERHRGRPRQTLLAQALLGQFDRRVPIRLEA